MGVLKIYEEHEIDDVLEVAGVKGRVESSHRGRPEAWPFEMNRDR